MAFELGLPTSYSLEPYMYQLIDHNHKITDSFLINLELFDERGLLVGLEETDAGHYLVGYKNRKGGGKAQQKVKLDEKMKDLVDQIIEITTPLRTYLQSKNDGNFRYLFLSSIMGFSYPQRIWATNTFGGSKLQDELRLAGFKNVRPEWSDSRVSKLVERISLTRFRSSCGIRVYLESGSCHKMADALGHEKYKPDLLSHYLPEPILRYFQNRWIRIFQKGIICEAMKDSPFLLKASHFKSMKELHLFLENHAARLPVFSEIDDNCDDESPEAYVTIDENILIALFSLEEAVERARQEVSPLASYWAAFSKRLKHEIENFSFDPKITSAYEAALTKIDVSLMKETIYA